MPTPRRSTCRTPRTLSALGGAIQLPAALDDSVAKARVCELLLQNGASSTDCPGGTDSSFHVLVNRQDSAIKSQMDVEVSHSVDTFFGKYLGIDTMTVRRKAQAQYDPPVAMGSPANNLGDVPVCPNAVPVPGCLSVPGNASQHLWLNVQGTGGFKQHGNALTPANCGPNVDGCTSGTNDESTGDGESFLVQNDIGGSLDIYVYDPGFVNTGPHCNSTTAGDWVDTPAVLSTFDDQHFCTGDLRLQVPYQSGPSLDTTFEVLNPDGSTACASRTFPGYDSDSGPGGLTGPNQAHAQPVTDPTRQGFHQWYHLCSIAGQPTTPGHEYRVHVASGGGRFSNHFSLLALHGALPTGGLTVLTRERLPIVAVDSHVTGPSEFYLARVLPSSKDRLLEVDFFDLGDTSIGSDLTGDLGLVAEGVPGFGGFDKCKSTPLPGNSDVRPAATGPVGYVDVPAGRRDDLFLVLRRRFGEQYVGRPLGRDHDPDPGCEQAWRLGLRHD